MKILDRLPYVDEYDRLNIHGEVLKLRPFQTPPRGATAGIVT